MKMEPFTELAESLNEHDANAAFVIKYKREIVTFNFNTKQILEYCDVMIKLEPAFLDDLTNYVIDKQNECAKNRTPDHC